MIEGVTKRSEEGRHLLLALTVAFVPAAVIGVIGEKVIKKYLFGVGPVIAAWAVGGVLILVLVAKGVIDRQEGRALETVTPRDAVIIGVAQVAAMWPGTSRSMVTIVAALLLGLSMAAAIEFSFLLGVLTLGAATAYSVVKDGSLMVDTFGLLTPLIGLVVAFVAAVISVRWMVTYLQRHSLAVFGWYRIVVAAIALVPGSHCTQRARSHGRSDRSLHCRGGAGRRDHRGREQGGHDLAVRLAGRASGHRSVGDQGDPLLPPGSLRPGVAPGHGVGRVLRRRGSAGPARSDTVVFLRWFRGRARDPFDRSPIRG